MGSPNFPFLLPQKPNETKFYQTRLQFPLCTNDIQHSCPIRPTIDSPLPSLHRNPSLLEMPSPRTGVDDGAFFKAARRTAIETGLFSGRDTAGRQRSPYVIE